MKTISQMKLECLRLAANLASAKQIKQFEVIPTAMEYYKWIDGNMDDVADVGALYAKFGKERGKQ